MRNIKTSFSFLRKNLLSIILFELTYKLLCFSIFTPGAMGLFRLSLHFAGFNYLSEKRLLSYATSPSTIIILMIMLLAVTAVSLVEMGAIVHCFHASHVGQKVDVFGMYAAGGLMMKRFLKHPDILLILFVMLIIPLSSIGVVSGYISTIVIPDFIMSFIEGHLWIKVLFWCGFVAAVFAAICWSLSIHCYVLEGGSYQKARKHSQQLVKKHMIRVLFSFLMWNILNLVIVSVITVVVGGATMLVCYLFLSAKVSYSASLTAVSYIIPIIFELYTLFGVPIIFSYISSLYYSTLEKMNEPTPRFWRPINKKRSIKLHKIVVVLVLIAALLNGLYLGLDHFIKLPWNQNVISELEITAHRGDSVHAPENTIPAFESAIQNQAVCAELDVAQTKDGVIVVVHDSNLKRVTGKNVNIWDITYEELQELDAGGWFSQKYDGTTIPTLDEVIKLCHGKIRLNIELKPNGHETGYVASVLSIIEENNEVYDCVVSSKNLKALKEMKELNNAVTTIYIMPIAYGSLKELEYIDGFSIESSSLTLSMVNKIHDSGKVVYAWTVNKEDSMKQMMNLGVDSIITDRPVQAREMFYSDNMNENLLSLVQELMKNMREHVPQLPNR